MQKTEETQDIEETQKEKYGLYLSTRKEYI